jgi:acetoin utilization protein AcuC
MAQPPLLVFGPRSTTYDFGPQHPLTPRRFGPGIDLLRALGAEPGLAPEPASDDDLRLCHTDRYVSTVKHLSAPDEDPWGAPEAGLGPGDNPPFPGMHDAAAAVAGGSIRAVEAILAGTVLHAFHPGGGLHHAMPSRAGGFCIYNDPALAIARARREGLRVLYVDLDVHHGDGVQAIHWDDPDVLTVSFHESGRYLFPGTGSVAEVGEGRAAGSAVNVPFEPGTGERAWLRAVETLLPELAAAFGPDLIVSQHGCDTHAWDPLAHLEVTTTAMGAAARLVDAVAHRWAGGRWLATGGGGYGVYGVVPRAWSHVWLAGAHHAAPDRLPGGWRARWAEEAARYGDRSLPETLDDPPNLGRAIDVEQLAAEERSLAITAVARHVGVPCLIREAVARGWWSPLGPPLASPLGPPLGPPLAAEDDPPAPDPTTGRAEIIDLVDGATIARLRLAPRLVANLDGRLLREILVAPGLSVTMAVDGTTAVGLVASALDDPLATVAARSVLAVGVTPSARRQGIATRMLATHLAQFDRADTPWTATVTVAERDPVEPLDRAVRVAIATRLFERAGFAREEPDRLLRSADPAACRFVRR